MSLHPDAQHVLDRLDAWTEEYDRLGRELAGDDDQLEGAIKEAAKARHARDLAYSRALERASGASKEMREAEAYTATAAEHERLRVAEADVKSLERLSRTADRSIERWRSHNAAMGVSLRESGRAS